MTGVQTCALPILLLGLGLVLLGLGLRCLEGRRRRKGIAGGSEGGGETPTVRSGSEPACGTLLLLSFQDSVRQVPPHPDFTEEGTGPESTGHWPVAQGCRSQDSSSGRSGSEAQALTWPAAPSTLGWCPQGRGGECGTKSSFIICKVRGDWTVPEGLLDQRRPRTPWWGHALHPGSAEPGQRPRARGRVFEQRVATA